MPNDDQTWVDGVKAISAEAGGLLNVTIVDSVSCGVLLAEAVLGNETALATYIAVREAGRRVAHAPRRTPVLCVTFPRSIKRHRERFLASRSRLSHRLLRHSASVFAITAGRIAVL
jgi:hypothetical protein